MGSRSAGETVARSRRARAAAVAAVSRSVELAVAHRRLLDEVQRSRMRTRQNRHFAYLRAEVGRRPVAALVRRDGSVSGHPEWLQLAERTVSTSVLVAGMHSTIDPMLTVLSLARTCDRLDSLRLVDVGDRGVYPRSCAVASMDGPPSPWLTIDEEGWDNVHVVRLSGELDLAGVPLVEEKLRTARCSELRVDLTGLTFCDVKGLSALLSMKSEREHNGCLVRLLGAHGIVRRIFEKTGLLDELEELDD